VRGLGGEPGTLDPRQAADNPSLALMLDLYEGLTAERPDGSIGPGAAIAWRTSADGLTWTFDLRPSLKWSDGTPLVATDFARGLDEARAPDTQAPYGELLEAVASVVAPSQTQLTIELKRPVPFLPALLALPVAAPAAPAQQGTTLVTNGPYRFVERRVGERITLERNVHYHAADTVDIDRVTWLTLDDLDTEVSLYRVGQLQVTSEVPNSKVTWLRQNLPGELHVAPFFSTYAYAINLSRLPTAEARTALAMSIDRESIVEKVTGAGELAAHSWVAPGFVGYPRTVFDWAGLPDGERRARAAALWREAYAGRKPPRQLTLCTDASANHHRTAVALADHWRTVLGVEVRLVELEWKAFLAQREHPGDCDLLRFGWSADFADPEAFLALFETGHPQNVIGYSSGPYDAQLAASRQAATPSERLRNLAAAEATLLVDVPLVPVFHRVTKRLVKPDVAGVEANPLGHLATSWLRITR
jgi:oligopeptide transport system substrate-binding protein